MSVKFDSQLCEVAEGKSDSFETQIGCSAKEVQDVSITLVLIISQKFWKIKVVS